jgi:Fe-S cluster biogenesis protein NfuA
MINYDILVRTQATPNPLAIKFVVNAPVKLEGKATITGPEDARGLKLAEDLFLVQGVEQLHLFENVITVSFASDTDRDKLIDDVTAVVQSRLPVHDANFTLANEEKKKKKRESRSAEIDHIEEILDRTIRPGLQADGGDIEIVEFKDNVLTITYEGACGSCPSSMYGTLDAIYSILRAEYDPNLDIMIA